MKNLFYSVVTLSVALTSLFFTIPANALTIKKEVALTQAIKDNEADQEKADRIIIAAGLYQVADKNDSTLAFAIIQASRAKTTKEVISAFEEAKINGTTAPFIDREQFVWLAKRGADLLLEEPTTNEIAKKIIDVVNDFTKKIEAIGSAGQAKLEDMPKEYTSAVLLGGMKDINPEVRHQIVLEIAKNIGRDYETVLQNVRDQRAMNTKESN